MGSDERDFLVEALAAGDVESVAERLGFEVLGTPVEGGALRAWGLEPGVMEGVEMRILAADSGFRLLRLDGEVSWSRVRKVIMAVNRAAPSATLLWWWTSEDTWTAAMVEDASSAGSKGVRRVKRLVLERDYPDEVGLMQWLSFSPDRRVEKGGEVDAVGWRNHFSEILDQDGVTRDFFRLFSGSLDKLVAMMRGGPEDEELRHDIALGTLLRVVFLYFLQARGALDGDRRFVMRVFRESEREGSFYRAVLRPLFFGALNCPASLRGEEAQNLGELPFLNGGLFEPTAAEEEYKKLDWEDGVWEEILEGLFERHRFAVEWSHHGEDLCRAVDPEMLGKVFEGLMYGDRRRRSGAFYTPREVVSSMVCRTLSAWIQDKAQLSEKEAENLLNGDAGLLGGGERQRAREALLGLTVLDPAVGTGAFLLEVLRVLRRVDVGLDEAEGIVRTPGERYDRVRRLIHDHLFGVDIQPTAVRLCELRIWLAMLAALPELPAREMPPLPNLSHRLCTGNSLIEPLDWVRYRVGKGAALPVFRSRFEAKSVERLAVLQRSYTRAHGAEKVELRRAMEGIQKEVQGEILGARIGVLRERLLPFAGLEDSEDLFGEKGQLSDGQRAEKERLEREISALQEAMVDLEAGRREEAAFSFDANFSPVMARGGFEVVITNPPWVRSGAMDGATRKLYKARFLSDDHRLWKGASEMGVRTSFGSQVDMAGLFLERSLELLREGGRLCALVPVKLFRSLHGAGLRGVLARHQVEYLEDRSEDEEAMFDATTYPAILRVRKEEVVRAVPKRERPVEVSVWRSGGVSTYRTPLTKLCVHGADMREPWMMVEPEIEAIFRKMQALSVSLGSVESMPIRRGVMTGYNGAFLMDEEEAAEKFSPETRRRYLRWAIQGRDVGEDGVVRKKQIIWPVAANGDVEKSLPAELEDHFEEFRERLEKRSDHREGRPIWDLFRRHEDIDGAGVVWRDMAQKLEAAPMGKDSIAMNTVYYIPAATEESSEALISLFHSEPMRAVAFAVGERARGGWRRHFAWVMRMLPVSRVWLEKWDGGLVEEGLEEAEIWRAYGLSAGEVARLRGWRCGGEEVERVREVA